MAANGISELATKFARQQGKLAIAEAKRQGKTVAVDGTITGTLDNTKPYYRSLNVLDITRLPDTYETTADDNVNTGGLVDGRPWGPTVAGVIAAPTTITESVNSDTLIDLQVWYDAADTDTFTPGASDEGQITQWNDKSVLAHNANSTGSSKPTYENTTLQNGYGYVEFDGVNDVLTVNPFTQLQSKTGFTVLVVAKALNNTGLQYLLETNQNDLRVSFNGTEVVTGMATSEESSTGLGFDTNWHVHTFVFNGAEAPDVAATNLYRLDKTGIVRTGTGTAATATDAANTHLYIGNNAAGDAPFTGYIGEVILFNRTLTVTEYSNVENYLTTKWAL